MYIFGEKADHISYINRPGAYAIVYNSIDDKIALVQTDDGSYFLPGGGVEEEESHQECLLREGREEIGYLLEMGRYVGSAHQYFYSVNEDQHYLSEGHFYLCSLGGVKTVPTEKDHHLRWVNLEEARELLFHEHQSWAVGEARSLMGS